LVLGMKDYIMNLFRCVLFIILFSSLHFSEAFARPVAPEPHPFTAPTGQLDLEVDAINFSQNRDGRSSLRTKSYTLPLLLRYGVASALELQLGADLFVWQGEKSSLTGERVSDEGFGDTLFGFKYNFWGNEGESPTAFAVRPLVRVPTSSISPERRLWLGGLQLPYAVDLTPGLTLEWTPEVSLAPHSSETSRTIQAGSLVSLNQVIGEITDTFLEFEHASFRERGRGAESYINLGLTFEPLDTLVIEPVAQVGVSRAAEDLRLMLTVVQRFGSVSG